MAKWLGLTALLFCHYLGGRLHAQGVVWFNTKIGGGGIDAPVFVDATLEGPGPDYSAQLYLMEDGSLNPLVPVTTFRPRGLGAAAIASRYVEPVDVIVPGHPSGSSVTLLMRAWQTAQGSFDTALRNGYGYGQSAPFTIQLGGDTLPAAYPQGLQSFTIVIPEPAPIVMSLGGALLLLAAARRR